MRMTLLICLLLLSLPSAWAKNKKICPKNTTTIIACVSNEGLPIFPFISVCQDDEGENLLAIDAGAARSVDIYHTRLDEEKRSITYKITDADGDNGELTIIKTRFEQNAATFRYDLFGMRVESSYECTF